MRDEPLTSPYLTTEQLAERWGVKPAYVRNLRHQRKAPAGLRVGKEVRFRNTDVEAWEQARIDADPLNQGAAA